MFEVCGSQKSLQGKLDCHHVYGTIILNFPFFSTVSYHDVPQTECALLYNV